MNNPNIHSSSRFDGLPMKRMIAAYAVVAAALFGDALAASIYEHQDPMRIPEDARILPNYYAGSNYSVSVPRQEETQVVCGEVHELPIFNSTYSREVDTGNNGNVIVTCENVYDAGIVRERN